MKRILAVVVCFGLVFFVNANKTKGDEMSVQKGKKVSFDYTLTVEGQIIDSSEKKGPFQYTHGEKQIIPGLASQLEGLCVGDEKTIEVSPKEAYGEINKEAYREIHKSALPEELSPKVGMLLQMQGPQGQVMPVRIAEVKGETIVLDLNHPLAGETLTFNVKIVSIE